MLMQLLPLAQLAEGVFALLRTGREGDRVEGFPEVAAEVGRRGVGAGVRELFEGSVLHQ